MSYHVKHCQPFCLKKTLHLFSCQTLIDMLFRRSYDHLYNLLRRPLRVDVKKIRLAAKMSQKEFCKEMGFSRQTLSSYENGKVSSANIDIQLQDFIKKYKIL